MSEKLNSIQGLKHGSLFSGIGGTDLAAEWMGWENIFHCEINPFGRKVLKHYWPNAISYEDITKSDFTIHRGKIDILTGGFPCQPYSVAGMRKGKEDERHLWPEMLRAIREIQPRWVVGENVLGIVSWNGGLVFEEVQAELEAEGYEVQAFILPAASVNAAHRRDRVWFIAYSNSNGYESRMLEKDRCQESKSESIRNQREWVRDDFRRISQQGDAPNPNYERLQGGKEFRSSERFWENRNEQLTGFLQPDWEKFPTQSPVYNGNDGLSSKLDGITFSKWRTESIKAGGNAIVPQVAHQIFKAIQEYDTIIRNKTIL